MKKETTSEDPEIKRIRDLGDLLHKLLTDAGCEVLAAVNEAVENVKKGNPLKTLDVIRPHVDSISERIKNFQKEYTINNLGNKFNDEQVGANEKLTQLSDLGSK